MRGLFLKTMVRRDLFRATVAATAALATGTVSPDTPATESSRSANKRRSRYQANSAEVRNFYRVNSFPAR
ncbi:hypothetical protein [Bradyrhizobium arachidis]|jgi:hypothetical protein|uniref:hypothetical protein n=1 Tax=Bradyrhizobium arachidis TaxID=858423 RepID=UPI0021628CC9|nr:hypothetical protein [Bradyrhizobium arachidis]UVO27180.1 hypothetical protein KUF59_32430 [Bradyrhizobium arachidis]